MSPICAAQRDKKKRKTQGSTGLRDVGAGLRVGQPNQRQRVSVLELSLPAHGVLSCRRLFVPPAHELTGSQKLISPVGWP